MRTLIILASLMMIGCAGPGMSQHLIDPPPEWTAQYGDSLDSTMAFNIAAMRIVLNQHAEVINSGLRATSQPTTQPVE